MCLEMLKEEAYVVPTIYPNVLPDGEYLKLFADAARLHITNKEELYKANGSIIE